MHIMYMLGIMAVVFMASLFLMCFFRDRLKSPYINPLLICATALFLFAWTYAMYEHNGLKSGFMTLDNISPYICTVIPLTPLMNQRLREYAYSAIAFLSFGMFVAMFVSPEVEYLKNYHQNALFLHTSEAACHLIMGLYGFYLILSGRVSLTHKSFGKALIFIYSSIGFGLFLNFFFHRSYFGMDMHGNYSIYFIDIFGSFEVTLIAYLLGVLFTMMSGYIVGRFLDWTTRADKSEPAVEAVEETPRTEETATKDSDMP